MLIERFRSSIIFIGIFRFGRHVSSECCSVDIFVRYRVAITITLVHSWELRIYRINIFAYPWKIRLYRQGFYIIFCAWR